MSSKKDSITTGPRQKLVLVPVAEGTEEIEAVTIIDTLVRGGSHVTVASVSDALLVTCSRGVKLQADYLINECEKDTWDLVVCPGGMPGAENLRNSKSLQLILNKQHQQKGYIGAICAAPAVVLAHHFPETFKEIEATGYPAKKFIDSLPNYSTEKVVVSGNIITSQGPGTALLFSLKLTELLHGVEKRMQLEKEMLSF